MRAMRLHETGGPLHPDDVPVPAPGPGEVLLRIHTCGINFADTLMVSGGYQETPDIPFAPGMEVCGTIESAGTEVIGLLVGDRVAALTGHGGLAEYVTVEASRCFPVPSTMSDEAAAGFLVAYGTSHVALDYKAHLQPGETLLVLGASGGIGLTAVEIGRLMEATVIASANGTEKLQAARQAGAQHLIDSSTADIRAEVKALGGADVVFDPVGGAQFDAALRACNPEARILPLGFASGEVPQIPANILMVKNLSVIGLYWSAYANLRPSVLSDSFARLFQWFDEGRLRPHVSHILPLEQANDALELLRRRKSTGKVVVRVS